MLNPAQIEWLQENHNLTDFPSELPPGDLHHWITNLPKATDEQGNPCIIDANGDASWTSGPALFLASMSVGSSQLPDYSEHMRRGIGIPASRQFIDQFVKESVSSAIVDSNGNRVPITANFPLLNSVRYGIVLATVYTGNTLKWSNNYAPSIVPITGPNGEVAVPLVGGFLWRGEDISSLQNANFPINVARERDGKAATIPVYMKGGRSILIPVDTHIHYRQLTSGGLELPTEPVTNEDAFLKKRVIAFQYVGVGTHAYIRHFFIPDGQLPAGQAYYSINGSAARSITDPRYWAKSGIILDLRHQRATEAPIGAMVDCEKVVAMERRLLENGAQIGAVTVGYLPLLTKDELNKIVNCDSGAPFSDCIAVQVKAILDSTNRLTILIDSTRRETTTSLQQIDEIVRRAGLAEELELTAHAYFPDDLNSELRYLSRLGNNLGTNFRAAIRSKLTIPWNENAAENLSLSGMLCDVENFEECHEPYNFASMALKWIDILISLSRISQLESDESLFIMLESFWKGALGNDTDVRNVPMLISMQDKLKPLNLPDKELDEIVAWRAAARITGLVVADIDRDRMAGRSINWELIRARLRWNHERFSTTDYSEEPKNLLNREDARDNWQTIAPHYYECLAVRAIFQAAKGETPNIKWY